MQRKKYYELLIQIKENLNLNRKLRIDNKLRINFNLPKANIVYQEFFLKSLIKSR